MRLSHAWTYGQWLHDWIRTSTSASGVDGHPSQWRSSIRMALHQRRVEVLDGHPQLVALLLVRGERVRQPPLALVGHPEVRYAGVRCRLGSFDQPCLLRAADELGHRALRELEAVGELRHGRLLSPVGRALD